MLCRRLPTLFALLGAGLLATVVGCGGSAAPWAAVPTRGTGVHQQQSFVRSGRSADSYGSPAETASVESAGDSGGGSSYAPAPAPAPSAWDAAPAAPGGDLAGEMRRRLAPTDAPEEEQARYAENGVPADGSPETATDGTTQPLLIYTAHLGMAVHQVSEQQERVLAIANDAGGHLDSRTDDTIVVRIPAGSFDAVIAAIRELGTVVTQQIDVQDVTAAFRDTQLRIRTLEAMRARVEQLLAEANTVEAALAVEQHLERITLELESLRGQIRLLSDQIALSTITVRFAERTNAREQEFQLPFRWLHTLGLQTLMAL